MKITLRLSTELDHVVEVAPTSTFSDLYSQAIVDVPDVAAPIKLIYNGEKLPNDNTLLSTIGDTEAEIILMSDSAPKKKKKVRCSFIGCSSLPLRMVGNCQHCHGKFCAKHRLFEDHVCEGLSSYKTMQHERNGMKLLSEATKVATKV